MEGFKRVEPSPASRGLSVQCAGCGRMVAYDRAYVGPQPFRFYHEGCAQALDDHGGVK